MVVIGTSLAGVGAFLSVSSWQIIGALLIAIGSFALGVDYGRHGGSEE